VVDYVAFCPFVPYFSSTLAIIIINIQIIYCVVYDDIVIKKFRISVFYIIIESTGITRKFLSYFLK